MSHHPPLALRAAPDVPRTREIPPSSETPDSWSTLLAPPRGLVGGLLKDLLELDQIAPKI